MSNARIDVETLYGSLIPWALHHWQDSGQALQLALDTTMLWNRYCVVVVSMLLLWIWFGVMPGTSVVNSCSEINNQVCFNWNGVVCAIPSASIALASLQQFVANAKATIQAWLPIPLQQLEACIPSRGVRRQRKQPWLTRIDLPQKPAPLSPLAVS